MVENMISNSILGGVTLVAIAISVALVYISLEAYRTFKLKIFKQAFAVFMFASYILLVGSMITYFGVEVWSEYGTFKVFMVLFIIFGVLFTTGIIKMIEAAQMLGIGKMPSRSELKKLKKKKSN